MKKIQLGKSDVSVTPITFGAWAIGGWMWGGADEKDAIEALETSLDLGISSIDTAPIYGFGKSEELVGKAIRGKRDKVEILTKYGMKWEGEQGEFYFESVHNDGYPVKIYKHASRDSVIAECEDSLRRLNTDYIDLYQIHWPDATTSIDETMEAVDRLIQQGKVRAAGVCNYDATLSRKANETIRLASVQVPYSMVRRDIEENLVPWCREENVSILAYSPLQRGLLTGKITPDYEFGEGDNRPDTPYFQPGNIQKVNAFLEEIQPIADGKNATLSQLVLAWTIAQPGITVALAGARNRKQVEDNAGAMELRLSRKEIEEITAKLDELELDI
ncbi:MAG: aldo/keto reductase [Bacteroidales bacterium]|nr:aldo/keto reductase [Bacteroidales bacterium]MDT8431452.1 aldo/keto reductase [Bacteroidales bacterium]